MTLKNSSLLPLNGLQIIYSTGYSYQIYLLFLKEVVSDISNTSSTDVNNNKQS